MWLFNWIGMLWPRPFKEVMCMRYLGLDVGKRYVQACLLNDDGSVVREGRYRYDEDGLEDISFLLDEDDMAVLESTGNLWVRIYDLLRDRVLGLSWLIL